MKIPNQTHFAKIFKPEILFCIGWSSLTLLLLAPFGMPYETFIHMWRIELFSALLVGISLLYLVFSSKTGVARTFLSRDELHWVVFPICAMILWSVCSAAWAPSWKSAFHHTAIWSIYLAFYIIVRAILESDHGYRKLMTAAVAPFVLLGVIAAAAYVSASIFAVPDTFGVRGKFAKYGEQVITLFPLVFITALTLNRKYFRHAVLVLITLWLLVFCGLGRINIFLFLVGLFISAAIWMICVRWRRDKFKLALTVVTLVVVLLPLHAPALFSLGANAPIAERMGNSSMNNESKNHRVLLSNLALDMAFAHPFLGIGADNFGFEISRYRAAYGASNPEDPNLGFAENEITTKAHNEFLQIVAELGAVGAVIIFWLILGICVIAFRVIKSGRRGSPFAYAAVAGLLLFLISSLVSSYSFRLIQNGFVFFFILAVASRLVLRNRRSEAGESNMIFLKPQIMRAACALGILACVGLIAYSTIRVTSAALTARANETRDIETASQIYLDAMQLDNENPDARNNFGMRLLHSKRYGEAAEYIEESIRIGRGSSTDYFYLATAQALSGDNIGCEATLAKAAILYPRSTFVLSRYSSVLAVNNKSVEAENIFKRALTIDRRSAQTWRALIEKGPKTASELAAVDTGYMHVMELHPQASIYAAVTERLLNHPEEQRFSALRMPE